MDPIKALQVIQGVIGILAAIVVLYVSKQILTLRYEFMKEIEQKFVQKEVWGRTEQNHEDAHKEIGRTLDRLWKKTFGE